MSNASSGDQFQDLAFPPDYPASVAFVLRKLKDQKNEIDATVAVLGTRVTTLEGIAETLSGRITAVETGVAGCVKKSSVQSLDPSSVKLSPASIREFLVTMVNAMKAGLALAVLVPAVALGGGKDIYGNDLSRTNKIGYVDGDLTTVGDIADFGPASLVAVSNIVNEATKGFIKTETDPSVPHWAKQADPPSETDPTVPAWAKQADPPSETDPTVPAWAKAANPPASGLTTNEVVAIASSAAVTNAGAVAVANAGLAAKADCVNGDMTMVSNALHATSADTATKAEWTPLLAFYGTTGNPSLSFTKRDDGWYDLVFGTENEITRKSASPRLAWRASPAVAGDLAALDEYGNPTDSGIATNALVLARDITTNNTALVAVITNSVDAAVLAMVADAANTNAVAVLNETLGKDWQTYGGGLGGLLAAILAGLAILKKTIPNKDTSLSVSGAYADAKTVGERLALRATVADLGNGVFRISDNVVDTTSTKVLY